MIRPSKHISTYDGVLYRSVSGVTTLSVGVIIKSPGGLGWTLNPFEMTTLFHAEAGESDHPGAKWEGRGPDSARWAQCSGG